MKTTVAGLGLSLLVLGGRKLMVPTYQMVEVFDGDSFLTAEKRSIRLASINAPEMDKCGGVESKKALTEYLKGKDIYLKTLYVDEFRRMVSLVYTKEGLVNELMLQTGHAYYTGTANEPTGISAKAVLAKEKGLGIYGEKCIERVNPKNKDCKIKGNISLHDKGKAYFRTEECSQYGNTLIQTYIGDAWFCSIKEAKEAGFEEAPDCKK